MCWFEHEFEPFLEGVRILQGHHFKQNVKKFEYEIVMIVIRNVSLGLVTGS